MRSRTGRILVLAVTGLGGIGVAWILAAPGVADYLARGATTAAALERALAWDPHHPALHRRLATAYAEPLDGADFAKARRHLAAALSERPTHAGTWLQLALLADRQGEASEARGALAVALRLHQHNVDLRWEAALLALRWGDPDQALDHLRYVIAADPMRRDVAFVLARTLLGAGDSVARLLPDGAEALTGLLAAGVRQRDLVLAEAAWERRATRKPPIPVGLQRDYLELLLGAGQGAAARRVWLALAPGGHPGAADNVVWDPGFEADRLLGWGLDWQVARVWGVQVALDRLTMAQGRQSLRLTFNSFPTLDFAGVFQEVVVEPEREYRLQARVKALGFATSSGLKLQVVTRDEARVLGETAAVTGTTDDWVLLTARVLVPPTTSVVRVQLRREKAAGPEGNLGGKIWVDDVSLTRVGGAGDEA